MGEQALLADLESRRAAMIETRRDLHMHPETAFREHRTAGIVAERLRAAGLEVRTGLGETGVVGVLRGGRPGPVVLVRPDMDGLPVQEQNDLPFRSRVDGKMHACGHDGHTAVGLALAETLAARRESLPGAVVFAFQPAEEIVAGARPMIEQGALEQPHVDASLAFHFSTEHPTGVVAVRGGAVMASADRFEITVRGMGGHGAYPHRSVDSILVGAQIVVALQALVAREVAAVDKAVISIGTFQAGTAFNILPPRAELSGTLRTLDADLRERLARRIGEVAQGIAATFRAEMDYRFLPGCPPVVNDPAMTDLVRRIAREEVGAERTIEGEQHMGADDAGLFLAERPGCYFFVGTANPAVAPAGPHHSPEFGLDEASLPIAARIMLRAVLATLRGERG